MCAYVCMYKCTWGWGGVGDKGGGSSEAGQIKPRRGKVGKEDDDSEKCAKSRKRKTI